MPVEFRDPPPRNNPRQTTDEDVTALIERSGQWAVVATYRTSSTAGVTADRIKNSMGKWRGHRWEAAVRKQADHAFDVYVRHITKGT